MFIRILLSVFLILHGLVHLLYLGQSRRFFELVPGMTWPDGSWVFSKLNGAATARIAAVIFCALSALGFAVSGVGLLAQQGWWRVILVIAAAVSSVTYILLWDGKFQKLHDQGALAILINITLVVVVFVPGGPAAGF